MKFGIISVVMIILFSSLAMAEEKPFKTIDAAKLEEMQKSDSGMVLIDSRSSKYFDGEVIQGAVNLPASDTNADSLAKIASVKSTTIVFYCQNTACPASELAAYKAAAAGYKSLYKYPGGIEDWKNRKLPVTKIN